jgi:single-strand DNA-binding protein
VSAFNKVIILGNLGRDPEIRRTGTVTAATISIATTEKWKDRESGEQREATEWHRVVMFDRLAEIAEQYLKKGRQVLIEGKLKTRKWTDQQGVERYTTEIHANQLQLVGPRDDAAPAQPAAAARPAGRPATQQSLPADDDVPF